MNTIKDKVAIVTGAASGIGKATALLFAQEGAKVVVSDIAEEEGKQVVKEIENNGGDATFIKADTSQPDEHKNMVEETLHAYGKLDIAVNNAGIGGPSKPLADYSVDEWQQVLDVNLSGVFYGMKYQIPAIEQAEGGNIINMASILGQAGFATASAYVTTKHGVVGLTKTAAIEYADSNIRVNAVGPGFIYSGMVNEETMGKETIQNLETRHPMGRLGNPEEIAEMCLFLASDRSSFVTGSYYPVDGGYLAV